jgi:hypothetical protein
MAKKAGTVRFTNGMIRYAFGIITLIVLLAGISNALHGSTRLGGSIALAVGLFFAYRTTRCGVIIIDQQGVATRGLFLDHRYAYADLAGVEVDTPGARGGYGREHLLFHLADGRRAAFRAFSSMPTREGAQDTAVRWAANAINQQIERARSNN